jgi:hypothetical protein
MAEHPRLSEERLKLIHRFMGESAVDHEERSDPPETRNLPEPLDLPRSVQPVDPGRPSAGPRSSTSSSARSSPERRRTSIPRARARAKRKPITTGLGPFLRHHFRSRWPAAAIFLGVIVGVLIARAA